MDFDRAEFWNRLLGQYDVTDYLVYGLFFLIGAAIFFYTDVKRSLKHDSKTPNKFSFWFMIKDNLFRLFVVCAGIFIAIRFHEKVLGIDSLNEWNCLYHGVSIDALLGKTSGHSLKQIPQVKKKREKEIEKIKNGNNGTH